MLKRWIDINTESESESRVSSFWKALKNDLAAGEFWTDKIKKFREEPHRRLTLALEKIPLPAAFREAAVALRALIRAKRRNKETYEVELTFLYWLAVVRSFILDYAPKLKEPGFNVMESIPGSVIKSLPFTYHEIGYDRLELLNKTDCKWIVEAWGEAQTHSTLYDLHKNVWNEYESKLMEKRKRDSENLFNNIF